VAAALATGADDRQVETFGRWRCGRAQKSGSGKWQGCGEGAAKEATAAESLNGTNDGVHGFRIGFHTREYGDGCETGVVGFLFHWRDKIIP
jgi:hypothetical protein